jgi:hypothetical protein
MYAVVSTGGKQYRVQVGDDVSGHPGLRERKGPKLTVFKYKNKTGYRRRNGHRQRLTRIRVDEIARRFGLPFRSGGGLTASQTADAQGAYEALMTLLPTFLAGANWVMHSAGWLEGGLVSGFEKFVIDVQLVEMLQHAFRPLEIDEASLAFDAHEEVGHGGHFLGAMHTMERFRTCFYRPFLSSSDNFDRWVKRGAKDTAARAADTTTIAKPREALTSRPSCLWRLPAAVRVTLPRRDSGTSSQSHP